jgi:hypothetical protein
MTDKERADSIRKFVDQLNEQLGDGYRRGFEVHIFDSRGNEIFGTLTVQEIKKVTTEVL